MAVKPFSNDDLNFLKFAAIVFDEFPKAIRHTFVTMWDKKIGVLPGYQLWDDSPAVRNMLLVAEGGKTNISTNLAIDSWDCTMLFTATIFAKTFAQSNLAKDAFRALNVTTNFIDSIGGMDESDFPTEKVDELNIKIYELTAKIDELNERNQFLQQEVIDVSNRLIASVGEVHGKMEVVNSRLMQVLETGNVKS